MTSLTLAETRAELVEDLQRAGFAVSESPERTLNAPGVLIMPAGFGDFIASADTFPRDEVLMRLDLFLVPRLAEGAAFLDAVTSGVQRLILGVDDRWNLGGVSAPFRATNLGGQVALRVLVSTTARLEEQPPL